MSTGTMRGMDTAAGLQAVAALEHDAQEITALTARVEQAVRGFAWVGPDADHVRETWTTTNRPQLTAVTAHLTQLAALIRREAQAQDDASGGGTATAGPGPTVGSVPKGPDPSTFRGEQAQQPDRTTCGSSSLVMARMINDPAYAAFIMKGVDPVTGKVDPRTPGQRFAAEALAMHERTNATHDRNGNLQLPWPTAFGTNPWATANEMSATGGSGVPGTTYGVAAVVNEDRNTSFDRIVSANRGGHAVPVYIGDWTAKHVVLATASPDGDHLSFYEPSSGRTVPVSREQWVHDQETGLGFTKPYFVIAPKSP